MQAIVTRTSELHRKAALKNSIYEGVFANMFGTLTGGVFLTGFGLYLGMDDFMIGLLVSMPFLVTVFQLPASYLMGKNGGRKRFWYWGAAISRLTWLPIVVVALVPISPASLKLLIILGLVFLAYSFNAVSGVSWLSLMSDLVPTHIRGRFFGTRNMLCGAAGMAVLIVFGKLLDYFKGYPHGGLSVGFSVTFVTAAAFGVVGLVFLRRVSEPHVSHPVTQNSFRKDLTLPFKEPNFRRFLTFAFLWSFSVFFAAPFFTLFYLEYMRFSYGFIAALGLVTGCADFLGMRVWGRVSDKVRNKAVIRFASWVAIFTPFVWVFVSPGSVVLPIIFNFMAGGFWAGINLCMNNLLLEISPEDNKAVYLSTFNILAGLGATISPIIGGLLLQLMANANISVFSWKLAPIHVLFLISFTLRLLTFQLFHRVRESHEAEVGEVVSALRSSGGINITTGFSYLLHPFAVIARKSLR